MRSVALVGILLSTTILGGCAGTIGGITLSSISSFAGLASTLFTGADLGEHAASLLTGKDCRFTEGLMREDRDVCEVPGSLATRDDFHGIFVERIDPDGTVIYAAPKYMPASFGAGEYENKPDAIWAAIKTQKFAEENERQLARANAAQTIDVAALATGSVSSESLAFLPADTKVDAALADGEPASQTAQTPRTVTNPVPQAAARRTVATPAASAPEAVELPLDTSQPAIDEKSFAASVQPRENGEGGPLIATTATSSAPVVSTLVHGEPVVVLRLRPIFSANAGAATTPVSSATPTEAAGASPNFINTAQARTAIAPSPLAILDQTTPVSGESTTVAAVEPAQLTAARPRVKPAEPIAAPKKPELDAAAVDTKAVKPVRVAQQRPRREVEPSDVYQPPARLAPAPSTLSAQASALHAPVQTPGDVPAEPASAVTPMGDAPAPAATSEPDAPAPAASGGPAPLVPMPQE